MSSWSTLRIDCVHFSSRYCLRRLYRLTIVARFWSPATQSVESVSNFIREENSFTDADTDKALDSFVGT